VGRADVDDGSFQEGGRVLGVDVYGGKNPDANTRARLYGRRCDQDCFWFPYRSRCRRGNDPLAVGVRGWWRR